MGTIDNIYVINYLINRQIGRKEGKMAMFVDLKAAFDSVDRGVLIKEMRAIKGIKEGLVERE